MRHKIKFLVALAVFFATATCCFGKQISFQVVQHNKSVEKVSEEALVVEDALISSFFDNGYIVTNSPASLSNNKKSDGKLWKIGMQEALDGGVDYFVQVILHFTEKKGKEPIRNTMILEKVEYTVSNVETLSKTEGHWNCNLEVIEADDLKSVSDNIISELYKVIKA